MKITNNTHLEKSGQYFRIVEKNDKDRDINVREFGTVYQALWAIVEGDYDIDNVTKERCQELLNFIDKAKDKIKDEFRVEVGVSKV